MLRRSNLYQLDIDKLRRNMAIPAHRKDMVQEIYNTIPRCHFEKLRQISVQIGKERIRAIQEKNVGKSITDRQASLLSCDTAWRMVMAEYNKDVKQPAFLFAAFNILEDSMRVFVLENYRCQFSSDNWHINDATWPDWVRRKYTGTNEHTKLISLTSSRAFLESLSFGELIAFIYDYRAWTSFLCKDMFENRIHPDNGAKLKDFNRCMAFERLKILQDRRNRIFHHKTLEKEYKRPTENSGLPNSCDSNRGKNYTDGNASNTLDRIIEILNYMGISGNNILSGMSGNRMSF